ncbi:cysteine alpha-hairpin motif superfamily [Yarrowia lipolytica]|uniref:YALI0C17391p n=2 Tax=Yarrowia lipolytica TaxID=4952 RepID=Q6CBM0_YARLI|nr:YALI0C17391p [Yarrowia lipolytica CLIB122]KAB8283659.1 cysteine alpha-hairpin motif superfamily [Yarrowia lipolytica]KAE8172246.1 cysteine alpha-hairpin motif superfamily [Yarrowia lipolytica]KAJ8053560.1 cysteine alpha-hairpin motif superfamily [Yarrowia lipolytica]QNP96157.1 Cytochrome c oxidase copper chaperone [Yarrowia lipolytica]RDW22821.1 cysteine alpha-hairpin motif superfamily [Yarrowia lipolytica]|eukprot:XP_501942.2 YALI0C17391p [Yarrowia lipolytica CLIB122]
MPLIANTSETKDGKNTTIPSGDKPKPCCVCKDEKAARDECLLFNGVDSDKCKPLISAYKECMKGFGFDI